MVSGHTVRTPITGISSMATRQVLAELAATYERLSGQPVAIESVGGVDAARRIQDGEAFDIVVLAADALDRLAAAGCVDPASRVALARSGIAMAVAAGQPHPDVRTEAALRDAVLGARSIGYSTGPSGTHLTRLFERWGIAETIASRIVQAPPGVPVGALVARGDVALGFQQLSELIHLPGIDVIGALPPEAQSMTVFAAAICTLSNQREAAQALLAFLTSREADGVKSGNGMEPA
ncbi:substrate-binding domain-containing protein [Paraburkholderia ginsengisoli]|uniref:Substrate-binding domain-containing protein n=1 Tax=Paraburkholderia ginsengisoli TaxID=311231 RepID=A0A7T4TBW9_9BURK|nr:substrate-binding domain-containing protein [Paraburkholderia ginsengisoli]QQC66993.1 substrate-binding domain-containing protein [Paraburkholderia ginsengisoli]